MSPPNPSSHTALLAGAIAGTTVDLSLFPLDTLKTRLQAREGFISSGGFRGIYRGIGSVVVGSAPGAAFFFLTYEWSKKVLSSLPYQSALRLGLGDNNEAGKQKSEALTHMLAASAGEIAACAVRVPTEVIKQRAQAGQFGGRSLPALRSIISSHLSAAAASSSSFSSIIFSSLTVWRELYRGWSITILREVPFTMIQFPLWEKLKALSRSRHPDGFEPAAIESAAYGSIAGAVAAGLTTPLDVLKTRVMLSARSVPAWQIMVEILRENGVRPFFSGIGPRVMWISAGGFIFLGSYQAVVNAVEGRRRPQQWDPGRAWQDDYGVR